MAEPTRPAGAVLNGSVPLPNAEAVFRAAASTLGTRLRRVPDGETGERLGWVFWQLAVFTESGQFGDPPPPNPAHYAANIGLRRKPGVAPSDVRFDSLGYAREAIASYEIFSRLQGSGDIPEHWRFQVCMPTPLAVVSIFVDPAEQAELEPVYEEAMRREVMQMAEKIPPQHLAVQWDTAVELSLLERFTRSPYIDDPEAGVIERAARYASYVPEEVELGYHFCYGDYEHRHFKEPHDAAILVRLANAVARATPRRVDWMHIPVPRNRDDDGYFEPLRDLDLDEATELYLGLVHYTDGLEGTRSRIDTASRFASRYGVATECGMGRRPPETVAPLLELHAAVSDPII